MAENETPNEMDLTKGQRWLFLHTSELEDALKEYLGSMMLLSKDALVAAAPQIAMAQRVVQDIIRVFNASEMDGPWEEASGRKIFGLVQMYCSKRHAMTTYFIDDNIIKTNFGAVAGFMAWANERLSEEKALESRGVLRDASKVGIPTFNPEMHRW